MGCRAAQQLGVPQPQGCGLTRVIVSSPLSTWLTHRQHSAPHSGRAPLKPRCISCTATRASQGKCPVLPSGHTDAALLSLACLLTHTEAASPGRGKPRKGTAPRRPPPWLGLSSARQRLPRKSLLRTEEGTPGPGAGHGACRV